MIRLSSMGDTGEVLCIVMDRPSVRNALDIEHWRELADAVNDPPVGTRAIILTGAGDGAFCAGADLSGLSVREMNAAIQCAFGAVLDSPLPVLAHLNGPAVGAGAQLVAACDLVVAVPGAFLSVPAAALGLGVDPETSARFVALLGLGAARALLMTGERITSEHAHDLGLVSRLGDFGEALTWASSISRLAPLSVKFFKRQLRAPSEENMSVYQAELQALIDSDDHAEALAARAQRRNPTFSGR